MLRVLVRPKWIALLIVALAVASAFAWLGKWQVESAVASLEATRAAETQTSREALGDYVQPQSKLPDAYVGRDTSFTAIIDPRDMDVVGERLQDGTVGWWVIGHGLVVNDGVTDFTAGVPADASAAAHLPGLALVFGWAPDEETARQAAADLAAQLGGASTVPTLANSTQYAFDGRVEYGQAPGLPEKAGDPTVMTEMAPAHLINRWAEQSGANYTSYVLVDWTGAAYSLPEGVQQVSAMDADGRGQLNWLNIFYAIEWVVFAVFAIFIWWRLAREEFLREQRSQLPDLDELELEIRREKLRELRAARGTGTASEERTEPQAQLHDS